MRLFRHSLVLSAVLILAATPAFAQSRKMIGVGVGVSWERQDDRKTWESSFNRIIFRIPRPERLGIAWDIGTHTEELTASVGPTVSGSLRRRHALFGPGYTWRHGRTEVTASALVGPTFNRFELADGSPSNVSASADNSWALQPDVTCWIDLGPLVGLKLSANYLFAHSDLTINAGNEPFQLRQNGRRLRVQLGLVFGIY